MLSTSVIVIIKINIDFNWPYRIPVNGGKGRPYLASWHAGDLFGALGDLVDLHRICGTLCPVSFSGAVSIAAWMTATERLVEPGRRVLRSLRAPIKLLELGPLPGQEIHPASTRTTGAKRSPVGASAAHISNSGRRTLKMQWIYYKSANFMEANRWSHFGVQKIN